MSTEDDDDDKPIASGSKKRISDAEFATAKELYELGKSGIAELADEFGVSRQTLSKRFKDAGIVKGSRAHELTAAATTATKAVIERYAERRAEWIEETRLTAVPALKQVRLMAQKIAVEQMKKNLPMGQVDDDLRAMSRLNKILVDNIQATLNILRADEHVDEEDLPTLTIEDLTDEDILNHHISTGALPEDATIDDINT